MRKKTAILQVADTGPLESLVVMLQTAGYHCLLPNHALKNELRALGCDTVINVDDLVRGMGYEYPFEMGEASARDLADCDLYVDVKAHRNKARVVSRFPNLKDKVLWYRINGGRPEHVINDRGDHGDEMKPDCPILTPNQWYALEYEKCGDCDGKGQHDVEDPYVCNACGGNREVRVPWYGTPRYVCWPPFYRFNEYDPAWRSEHEGKFDSPICLIHNLRGWGYGALVSAMRDKLGVKCYGDGSPDGLVQHAEIKVRLSRALCMVHMKSSDSPGYSLYEALAAGCPIICTRRLIWRSHMASLFLPGETCRVFDRETHDGLTTEDVVECEREVRAALADLARPGYNREIGMAGREQLRKVMWDEDREDDVSSLRDFLKRNFP